MDKQPELITQQIHFNLCWLTATWAMKKFNGDLCLYEYQSFASGEHPDVLLYHGQRTMLFEIKTDIADFKRDQKKPARKKYKTRWYLSKNSPEDVLHFQTYNPELYYIQSPHLGIRRFYVCPHGLIDPAEVPEGWGLHWVKNGRFFRKKNSCNWRRDIHTELGLSIHAMRKYANSERSNIIIKKWGVE